MRGGGKEWGAPGRARSWAGAWGRWSQALLRAAVVLSLPSPHPLHPPPGSHRATPEVPPTTPAELAESDRVGGGLRVQKPCPLPSACQGAAPWPAINPPDCAHTPTTCALVCRCLLTSEGRPQTMVAPAARRTRHVTPVARPQKVAEWWPARSLRAPCSHRPPRSAPPRALCCAMHCCCLDHAPPRWALQNHAPVAKSPPQ